MPEKKNRKQEETEMLMAKVEVLADDLSIYCKVDS